ncbi:uncharacterized protein LOC127248300 [Andrographis paniculata]|uniref:uncharacterized protein LOC127248300 n=1 Tax=Andrographis paniculata TaxID=175694 RepID=UPI0021E73D75|nr:uncharacterized protein LOC127248300 [Andrographis paniculata]
MRSFDFDDYLGVESCADLRSEIDAPPCGGDRIGRRRSFSDAAEKEFPPPIPSATAAWVMRKYYTDDGRLVIRKETMERHDCVRAFRRDGRLVLNLVPLGGGGGGGDGESEEDEGGAAVTRSRESRVQAVDGCDEGRSNPTVGNVAAEFCRFNERALTPCGGFAVEAAAALRPPVTI